MSSFNYSAVASVCVVLLLGSACARDDASSSNIPAQRVPSAQEDGGSFDASADASAETGRADAGARTDEADASSEAKDDEGAQRARAGSGGEAKTTRPGSGQGGAGGTRARATDTQAGAGGQPSAGGTPAASEPEAAGGAGGARAEAGSESRGEAESGGAGGTRAEAGSESEGAAGEPGEPEEEEQEEPEGSSDAGAPKGNADAGAPSGSEEPSACELIASACAAVVDPSEEVTSCLSVGQAGDASACGSRIEDCRQTCGAPLCKQVLAECPASDAGPVQGCRQIGITDNAGDCFGDGVKCLDYCRMVETP